jgi:PhnB protein
MIAVPHDSQEGTAMVDPIPSNYPRVCVSLCVDGGAEAIDFYMKVLGATERMRMDHDGKVGHAELTIGESVIMINDEYPEMDIVSPKTIGGTPVTLTVYVDDADTTFAAAIAAGATELRAVEDQFYGDRSGQFLDPWGHRWNVASHIEDLDLAEIERRAAQMAEG